MTARGRRARAGATGSAGGEALPTTADPIGAGPPVPAAKDRAGDVAGNMLATLVGNFFPPLAMLVTAPILAHALGVVGRGEVAAATAPLLLVLTAATFGVPQAATYVIARSPAATRRATRMSLLLILLAGAVATTAVILAAGWLSGGSASISRLIVIASLAVIPSLLVAVLRGAASGLHLWRSVATERFISAMSRVAALVPLAITGHLNPFTATLVIAVGPLLGALAYIRIFRHADSLPDDGNVATDARTILSYGLRTWIGAISGILLSRLDQTLMTPLAGAYALGLYVVAATIADIPLIINSAVRDVTFSADAAHATDKRLGQSARISSTACFVVGLITAVSMPWWLPWLFGHEFAPAIPVAIVLIIAAVQGTPGSIAGAGLAARGRPGLRSISLVVACVINVGLLFVLVPDHGAMGAAIATLIGSFIAANSNIVFLWKLYGVPPKEFYGFRRDDFHTALRFARRMLRKARP
ncbi:flippase [Nakamurella flavida]|uniref:Flippase n=1 Tax=Nakamurella flavida TaxID=363630 RepID=A0A938YP82_9ACTN|nr:flippase [Nakamurella flavida]MBM9476854.1 flippase [Nakamurella flavida]MDP9779798.1 O-antigen/teichoic acid export membrane protein [Nakamurella flavida]